MIQIKYIILILITSSLLYIDSYSHAKTDSNDITKDFICFPRELDFWEFKSSLGFTLSYIPKAIVEEEIYYSPLIDFNARLGLPYNFSAHARINTIGITNHFSIGGQYSLSWGRFSSALCYDFGYWLGTIKIKGFNIVANGIIHYPGVAIGWDFGDFYASLKGDLLIVTFHETFTGETTAGGIRKEFAGMAVTYALEQPFWRKSHISMGVKLTYTKFFYQSWLSFSTFDRYLFFPEFFMGFIL